MLELLALALHLDELFPVVLLLFGKLLDLGLALVELLPVNYPLLVQLVLEYAYAGVRVA